MKKDIYKIEVEFFEKAHNHRVLDTWECKDKKSVVEVLCESLDLVCDLKGNIVVPSMEQTRKILLGLLEETAIKKEYNRQRKMYKIYNSIMDEFDELENADYIIRREIDKKTEIFITKVSI